MSRPNLRQIPRISYYEPDEPNFDEYLYCDECSDYVYEYCAVHGRLLVVPDDKVPSTTPFPYYVPRAALTIPHVFLHLAPSIIPGAGLGVFSTLTLPRGVRFGPYCGQLRQQVDSMYCWQISDSNNRRSHVVDAADGDRSNWMRYVNCARHWKEQNLLAYQYQGQLYYRTIKIIPRFTELMVFYGSEFANILHINLIQYNKKEYYKEIISASKIIEKKKDKNAIDHPSEHLKANIDRTKDVQEEYMNTDNLQLIYEENDEIINSKNVINNIEGIICKDENNKICTDVDGKSPLQVVLNGDNITITKDTEEDRPKCEICQKTFAKTKYLREHTRRHFKTYKYNCDICDYRTNYKKIFEQHTDKHTKTYLYSCEKCFYKTNVKRHFKRHSFRHENNKNVVESIKTYNGVNFSTPKQCENCDYKTCSHKNMSLHKSQNNCNIYNSDWCQYSHSNYIFSSQNVVNNIEGSIYENNRFCNDVDENSPLQIALSGDNIIITKNTEENRPKCEICQKTFAKTEYLRSHTRRHLKTYKYNCDICDYRTNYKKIFDQHTDKHTKTYQYSCEKCFYKTNFKSDFKRHSFRHENNKCNIYKCDMCQYTSHSKYNLSRHIFSKKH